MRTKQISQSKSDKMFTLSDLHKEYVTADEHHSAQVMQSNTEPYYDYACVSDNEVEVHHAESDAVADYYGG